MARTLGEALIFKLIINSSCWRSFYLTESSWNRRFRTNGKAPSEAELCSARRTHKEEKRRGERCKPGAGKIMGQESAIVHA